MTPLVDSSQLKLSALPTKSCDHSYELIVLNNILIYVYYVHINIDILTIIPNIYLTNTNIKYIL